MFWIYWIGLSIFSAFFTQNMGQFIVMIIVTFLISLIIRISLIALEANRYTGDPFYLGHYTSIFSTGHWYYHNCDCETTPPSSDG